MDFEVLFGIYFQTNKKKYFWNFIWNLLPSKYKERFGISNEEVYFHIYHIYMCFIYVLRGI